MAKKRNDIARVVKKESGKAGGDNADDNTDAALFKMIAPSDDIADGSQS